MIEKIMIFLFGLKMTIISGFFLALSLTFLLMKFDFVINPAWMAIVISGTPLCYYAFTSLFFYKKITSPLLISLAMMASVTVGELFAAAEVAFIMALGAVLEEKTVAKARRGIKKLVSLIPQTGRKIISQEGNSYEKIVPIEEILVGDKVRVLPGEIIPVDGMITKGASSIDQSSMTGESLPVDKFEGDAVFSATINHFGSLEVLTTKTAQDSTLQKFINMSEEAESKKAPTHRIMDKWASILVPIALSIAVVTFFITSDIIRAVTVLIVFCPCALALATPTAIMAAIGQATKSGVLIKSGEALEKIGLVNVVATDKTGTLTHGRLIVTDLRSFSKDYSTEELLSLLASVESHSEHPLAKSIVRHARAMQVKFFEIDSFEMLPGKGVKAKINNDFIFCGTLNFLSENQIEVDKNILSRDSELKKQGKAVIYVGLKGTGIGQISLSDTLKDSAKEMLSSLEKMNTEVVLLTGDHKDIADHFAEKIGIKKVHAGLLPDEKLRLIEDLKKGGKKVCMIGDGINDTLALKAADVSLAMGTLGSDIAIDAADIALMGDDIGKVSYLMKLSLKTIKTIKQNVTFSMTINFIAITLSVLGFLTPVLGALVHNASSVIVIINAALLYDRRIE